MSDILILLAIPPLGSRVQRDGSGEVGRERWYLEGGFVGTLPSHYTQPMMKQLIKTQLPLLFPYYVEVRVTCIDRPSRESELERCQPNLLDDDWNPNTVLNSLTTMRDFLEVTVFTKRGILQTLVVAADLQVRFRHSLTLLTRQSEGFDGGPFVRISILWI